MHGSICWHYCGLLYMCNTMVSPSHKGFPHISGHGGGGGGGGGLEQALQRPRARAHVPTTADHLQFENAPVQSHLPRLLTVLCGPR